MGQVATSAPKNFMSAALGGCGLYHAPALSFWCHDIMYTHLYLAQYCKLQQATKRRAVPGNKLGTTIHPRLDVCIKLSQWIRAH